MCEIFCVITKLTSYDLFVANVSSGLWFAFLFLSGFILDDLVGTVTTA